MPLLKDDPVPLQAPVRVPSDASAGPTRQAARDAASDAPPAQVLQTLADQEYQIGSGDVINVFAVDIDEINDSYTVGPDGRISLPYVGVITLQGVTRMEAAKQIEQKLKGVYLNPRVDVVVEEYNNNRIFVLGEVRWPGEFNFSGPPTLLGALARAQGLTSNADLRGCTIIRGRGTLIEVNLYDLLRRGNRQLNVPLVPEDTVYVKSDEDNTFYVLGEVVRPGAFARTEDVDLVEAIAQAGGFSNDARTWAIRRIRRVEGGGAADVETYDLNRLMKRGHASSETPVIQKGDIVYVPRRHVASFNYILRQITPSLNLLLLGDTVSETIDSE